MARAMNSYLAFYRLQVQAATTRNWTPPSKPSTPHSGSRKESLPTSSPTSTACYRTPASSDPHLRGAVWLGLILGLEAAATANEDATWVEDTPNTPAELLSRAGHED